MLSARAHHNIMICLKLSPSVHPAIEHCLGLPSAHNQKINLFGIPVS